MVYATMVSLVCLHAVMPVMGGTTFDAVKTRGVLTCGVHTGLYGFGAPDRKGVWNGLDVDICRAVAAAVFGNASKVRFVPLSTQQRLTALQSGEIDLLSRNTSWTLARDSASGLNFAAVTYYDGQGFMVEKALGVESARQLDGATICVLQGTTTELNLADYFRANKMRFKPVTIEKLEELVSAFVAGRCDAQTADVSQLASIRANDLENPDDYIILPEIISKEPLAPAVRHGDDQWLDIVKWTLFAMIEAEEKGITTANVDRFLNSADPTVRRLLGVIPGMGKNLGLDEKWAYDIIKQVGHYGEVFERNVGMKSRLKLKRGMNALWTEGGLMYAPPIR
ncbi:MAG: amino acid ABC transporter substrate-binding protein [Pseudomonadota bacterium]